MRNLKTCSICLVFLAVAACGGAADNNNAGNELNAAPPSEAAAVENEASANQAAPAAVANNAAAAADESYRASGIEPFWAVTIGGGQMVYDSADGPDITVATPAQQPTRNGYRYVTPELVVDVVHRRCTNPMSGENFPDTVNVRAGSQAVRGCGGQGGGVP